MLVSKSLSKLRALGYRASSAVQLWYLRVVWKMDLGSDLRISMSAKLDRTNPEGVHVGDATLISFGAAVLTHDFVNNRHVDTFIGSHCFIGAHAIVMPGVRIGDHCIIGAGAVVTRDVVSNSIAVGNPARVIRSGIVTGRWGIMDVLFLDKEKRR